MPGADANPTVRASSPKLFVWRSRQPRGHRSILECEHRPREPGHERDQAEDHERAPSRPVPAPGANAGRDTREGPQRGAPLAGGRATQHHVLHRGRRAASSSRLLARADARPAPNQAVDAGHPSRRLILGALAWHATTSMMSGGCARRGKYARGGCRFHVTRSAVTARLALSWSKLNRIRTDESASRNRPCGGGRCTCARRRAMKTVRKDFRVFGVLIVAVAMMALGLRAEDPPDFKPDGKFTGSALTGWRVVGQADWKAENGELIGRAKTGDGGGWLFLDKSFQDLQFYTNVRCQGACKAGVLFRAEKTPDGGTKGIYVSLTDGDLASYRVTLDAQGNETARDRIRRSRTWRRRRRRGRPGRRACRPWRGRADGSGCSAAGQAAGAAAPAAQAAGAAAPAGQGRAGAPAAGRGGGGGGRGAAAAPVTLKAGEWNPWRSRSGTTRCGQRPQPAGRWRRPKGVRQRPRPELRPHRALRRRHGGGQIQGRGVEGHQRRSRRERADLESLHRATA